MDEHQRATPDEPKRSALSATEIAILFLLVLAMPKIGTWPVGVWIIAMIALGIRRVFRSDDGIDPEPIVSQPEDRPAPQARWSDRR